MNLRKLLMLLFLAVVVCVMSAGVGAAAVITVDNSGGADFTSIQAAVDAASAGDTIEVRSGTYVENVVVNKQLILRGIDTGAGMPVVDAGGSGSAITLNTDGIILEGFDVRDSGNGIYATSNYNTLTNNTASNNNYGIYLYSSSNNNTLTSNNVSNNNYYGILLHLSSNNTLTSNKVNNNNNGIYIYYSSNNNTLTNNTAINNNNGIYIYYSNNNTIYQNDFIDNINYNAYDINGNNQWDWGTTGNYYSDYIGNDSDGDGIGDTSHPILGGNSVDRYPLMEPKEPTIGPVHNINKGINHTSIQTAINAARPGDEIHVDSGTYYENVVVNKQLTLRGIDTGAGMPVVDAGGITLNTDGIILDGFDVRNSGNGIYVTSNYNTLTNNNVSNSNYGIYLYTSSNNTLTDNTVSNNSAYGIYFYSSSNNTLTDNAVSNNNAYGIYLYYSSNNNLTGNIFVNDGLIVLFSYQNTVENNMVNGKPLVYLEDSSDYVITDAGQTVVVNCTNITVDKLVLSNSIVGIELWQTNNSKISDNVINDNYYGIYLYSSGNNSIINNTVINNSNGIYLYYSSNNNTLTSNNVSNSNYGICLYSSSKNTIYQNNLNNTNYNTYDYNGNNQWDWGTIGNYYSDYTGTDSNGDGIGDTPYPILGGSSVDRYPLMKPWTNTGPVHNINKGTNYRTIQAAINAASPDDEIHVDSGEYHENVNVNKQLILRGIDTGDGKPVVNASNEWGTAIILSAGWTTLEGFNVRNSGSGIYVASNNNLLRNNTVTDNDYNGISLGYSSSNNTLRNNSMSGNRYNFDMNIYWTYQPNNISTDNRVDGKYIYYLNGVADIVIDEKSNAGIVYCIKCDNVTIKNSSFTNNGVGVYFYKTNNSKIENVITSNNSNNGIYLQYSDNTILQNNYAVNNGNYGIYVSYSNNITLTDNTAIFNSNGIYLSSSNDCNLQGNIASDNSNYMESYGIRLDNSNNNTLRANIAMNNTGSGYPGYGIYLTSSKNNVLIDNSASYNGGFYSYSGGGIYIGWNSNSNILINNSAYSNTDSGIVLSGSNNNTLQSNLMSGNNFNFEFSGWYDSDFYNNIDTSNLVDGKPIYYLVGACDTVIDSFSNAGTVYCINCENVTVKDLTLSNNRNGIYFHNTSNSKVQNNWLRNNEYGIHLGSSSNDNTITGNIASDNWYGVSLSLSNNNTVVGNNASNNYYGIQFSSSSNNILYQNNLVNNSNYNAYDYNGNNQWDWGTIGNYYSDYTGTDSNGDGIGDTTYPIPGGSSADNYPLMAPWDTTPTTGPVHNINKGTNYTTIQVAINAASPGDQIHVDSGMYYENVIVNKQLILCGIDTGAGLPEVDAGESGSAITLNTDGIILEGFDVRNSSNGIYVTSNYNTLTNNTANNNNNYGIYLYYSSDNVITNNNISNNNYGIDLYYSSNNTLTDNTVSNNNTYGINLRFSRNNNLTGNIFVNEGLFVLFSYQNTVENNMVNGKPLVYLENSSNYVITDAGQVVLVNCTNITVEKLVLSNLNVGIELWQTNNGKILDNVINDNDYGIYLYSSSNNSITNNIFNKNNYGIVSALSNNNTLTSNNVSNSYYYGIYLSSSSNNTIYQNNLDNTNYNAYDYYGNNQWDWGTIGNYYSDYTGTDSNGDGIGDTPYQILGGSSVDNYPLMTPWDTTPPAGSSPELISWGNNKTNDVSSNLKINVFETVQFNATANQTIQTWNWFMNDINQNNNIHNLSIQFDSTGTYTVKVNATNLNGTSNTCTWNIEVNEPSISISNTDILTWKGQNKTFEIKLKNIGITDIAISEMNTNQSWIHSVSTMPALGPNDEKSIYFSMYVPNDISAGNYKFPLNISLDTGYVFDKQLNVTIFNEPTSYVLVKVVDDKSGEPIPEAMVMVDGNDTIHYVDSNGITNIKTMPEAKSIYAFAVGYMPNYEVSYLELGQNNIEIRLSKGEVIISDFDIKRLNSTEIVEAGIDLTDTDNYWVYNFSVNLTVETVDLTEYDEWFNKTVIVPQCTLPTIEYETKAGFKVIAFPLELSGNVSGNVIDAKTTDSIPKAKVTVCDCSAETNISGRYFINGIPMGDYVAKASKKGFYDEFKPVNIVKNESTTLDFSLNSILPPPKGNIEGTVKDNETKEALSDAKVWIDGWIWPSTKTDFNGKYGLYDLPAGIHTVKITIDGYFSESKTVEVLDGQTIPVNFELVKIKYGDIQGTVTNKSSGIEISGAHFYIDRDFWPSGKTDSNGEYSVNYLQVGSHTVTLSANGYYSESKTVEVLEGQTLIVDFALTPLPPVPEKGYGNITGTVTDITNGQVISDADVKIDWYFGRLDETDLNGEYYFADLLEGRHTVTVRANGYYSESKTVNVVAGDTITIDFTLTPIINIPPEYGDIIGTVVDNSNGQIISGADVKIDWFFGNSDETDSGGEYYFAVLSEGRHTITVRANGYYSDSKTVTVIGNDLVTVDFALTPLPPVPPEEYGNIIGTVTDKLNGQVISDARVYVDGYFWPSDKTDLSGIYLIETLPVGMHTISVSANGYYRKSITVAVLKDQTVTVDFELIPYEYGNVEGTITDKSSKSVISGASVYIDGQWLWSSTKTDSNGYYLLETLPVGRHTIKIKANGYYSASKTVNVPKDKTITVDFELVPIYGVIKGTVRDLNTNNPILGAKVSVEGKSVNTNADGTYIIPNVKALSRSYRVVANQDNEYYYDYKDVQVKGGEISTVDFYLKPIPRKITAPYAFLIIPGQVKVLKEMFGISVIVVNNADPIFSINDTYVNLSLPEGISLVKLKGQDGGYYNQSFEKSIGNISGGSQNGTTWVARGDRSGTYTVNTKISTTLMPFRVPLTKKDSEQIIVHGKPNIELDFIQSRYVRQGLPFTFSIGVKNPEEYPVEGVAIELFNKDFENVTLDDNPVKFIGTIKPGETKYAFWQMLPNASGFIIIDKSSFNITDPNATATFDFIADTPEGALTAFLILSKEVVNSEVHAFSGVMAQYADVHIKNDESNRLIDLFDKISIFYDIFSYKGTFFDIIGIGLDVFGEEISLMDLIDDTIIENIINDPNLSYLDESDVNIYLFGKISESKVVPLPDVSNTECFSSKEIQELYNNKYEITVDNIRGANLSDYSFYKDEDFKNLMSSLQLASTQQTVIYGPEQSEYYIIGNEYISLYNSLFYIKKIEAYEEASDMITWTSHITSSASILLGGPFSLVVLGLGVGTADVVIQSKIFQYSHLFDANFVNSIYIYKFDLGGLSKVYFGTMDWVNNSIISDSAQLSSINGANSFGNAAYTSSLQTANDISLNTPDVLVTADLFGYSIGYLNITSNNPNSQNISGIILIRNSDTQNSISQIINLSSVELQPYETKSIEFNYSGILLPGMPRNYISQAYVSVDGSMLDPLTSMFNIRNHNSTNRINLMNGTLIEKEKQSTNFTLPDYSESMIILSNEYGGDIDLHLNDPYGRHVGLNYTTGSIDYEILGVTYSGPGIYPEWMTVRNENLTDYSISTFAMMAPESVNFSVDILTLKALDTMIVSPRKINSSISIGNTSNIIINIENIGFSPNEIHTISLDGDVKDIVSYVSYPKSIADGSVGSILLKIEPKIDLNKIYTGSLFINTTFQEMSVDLSISVISTDSEMPDSVSNLLANPGLTWLNFTWTNPSDPDFSHTELYLNGTFLTNIPAPQNYYNATGLLPDTSYELSTSTVDTSGNINETWVNATARTLSTSDNTPPTITFISPTESNGTILTTRNWTFINVSLSEPGFSWLEWNGINELMSGSGTYWSINKTGLDNGVYSYCVWANDSAGNVNVSETRVIEIGYLTDTLPPIVTIISPVNDTTYNTDSVNLNYSVNEPTTWQGYSLDGSANITLDGNTTLIGINDGLHILNVYANDTAGNMNSSTVWFTIDTTPPAGIIELQHTAGQTWINWTWTNPFDPDFNHTDIYLNGTFLTNIPELQDYYNITGLLPDTSYELSTRTIDTSGNINETWVNDTARTLPLADTTPPIITFTPPTDPDGTTITTRNWTFINISLSEPGFSWLEWNGINESMSGSGTHWYINKTGLDNGVYTYRVWANDSAGNVNVSETRAIEIDYISDTLPPIVTIISPVNDTTYNTDSVDLNYSVNEPTTWQGYSTDGAANITLLGNTTLTGFTDGLHILTVYSNDTSGNMNSTTVWFTVDTTPPEGISDLQHTAGQTWINWIWTNPSDPDFNHTEIYLNGIFQISKSAEFFNATELIPNTEYKISTWTADNLGNINETWVNDTAHTLPIPDTTPPTITFVSPTDPSGTTLTTRNWTFINVSLSEPCLSWIEWNGINESMAGSDTNWYINKTDLVNGVYTYRVWANDTNGNENSSETRTIEIDYVTDNLPPIISIISPMNDTLYTTDSVELNYTVNEPTIWEGYSLDGADNISLIGNTTLFGLNDDLHNLTVYVNDTAGNMNSSTVWFTIDTTPPSNISNLLHTAGITWLNWTWTNPSDPDFNLTELYLNGAFLTNIPAPQNYYNITGLLPDTSYELSTNTVDINGNINETWVNTTAHTFSISDDTPPTITFILPTDPSGITLTARNWTFINVSLSEPGLSWLEWNGINESMAGSGTNWYINKTDLSNGVYIYHVWANDTAGNENVSETRTIEIDYVNDNLPPIISITSPMNDTLYTIDSVELNYSVNEPTIWEGYSLDGADNITLFGNTMLFGLNDGSHLLTIYANDTSGIMNSSSVWFAIDTTPPSNISDLLHTAGITWFNWTWTNPSDPDFNHTELYLNGTFLTNIPAPQNYHNTIGLLPDTSYELSTRTVDTPGNINETWVNATARTLPLPDTTPPIITFTHPTDPNDTTLTTRNWTFINISLSEPGFSWLEWNGINESMSGSGTHWYINKTELDNGVYTYCVWANDSTGNVNVSVTRAIEIDYVSDTLPPIVTIISPVNDTTYNADSVNLNYSVNEPAVWQGYSLDGSANITLQGNTTLTDLIDGLHTLTVYANDSSGNMNSSTVWFTIDATSPIINTASLNTTTPDAGEDILVTVNATDDTAVISVVANDVVLVPQGGDIWSGTITAIAGTHTVNVSATDTAGNIGWNNSTSYTATTQDTTPPAIISNLHHNSGTTWINWTWTNPPDPDFNHTEIYLNGIFQTNKSAEFFNATGLIPNTENEISTRTADNLGNINETWVNDTTMTLDTPPVSNASGPYTGIEGQAIIFNASASYDPDSGDSIASFEWDFNNDGATDATGVEVSWTWYDDYAGQVNLTVTDSHGECNMNTTSVTILNTPPEVEAGNDQTVNEGDIISFSGIFIDPGTADTHTIEWDFGDGTQVAKGTLTPTHTYTDNGTFIITLTVTDDGGASTTDTLNMTVENVAPIVDACVDQIANEGDIVSFVGNFTDPGTADTHLIEWDFGDATPISSGTLTPTHTYTDNGTYVVNLTVTDDDGASTSDTLIVTVNNVAPVLDECADQTVQWGYTMTFSRSFTDPGDDYWTAEIDWGDGSQEEGILSSKIITATHVYSIPGEYICNLTVRDDDGGVGSGDMQITVTTRATELEYIGDLSAQYSDYINLKVQLNDPGNNNPLPDRSISFILGTQTATATTGSDGIATTSFKLDQPAGSYDIKAEFAGDDSYSPDSDTKVMQISKEDTEITYTGDTILPTTAGSIDLRATLEEIDTDYGDSTKINVNFNIYKSSDLSYSNPVATVPSVASISVTSSGMGVGTATATIDNLTEDDYMVIARIVPNDYYLPISSKPTPMIVYEPTDQFTTGGGWIWDPTGSHGNFGFNVKYNKKGKVKGNSIYVYRLDGLDYIVKSNAWIGLAISDNTSTFQGKAVLQIFDPVTGELQPESSGNFQFTVEAMDNELNGNPDYYKITVLDKDGLEYHNATGSLNGGNIVIHDKKSK